MRAAADAELRKFRLQWKHHERCGDSLWELIRGLQIRFASEFDAARLEKNRKAREKRRGAMEWDKMSDHENEGAQDDENPGSEGGQLPQSLATSPSANISSEPLAKKRKQAPLEDITNVRLNSEDE
ncbi:hypothetical protein R3P38DRAFT_2790724 [Favolaschia claudopus]|uniref:Uncharacterized protein n=1 Tax=Favolaschia claudopus TaxID=2862362 RepID=A0AAW0AHJ0_9AGAR